MFHVQNKYQFNSLFSTTTWVSRKVQTILSFNEARDDVVAVESAGQYVNYVLLAPDG